jgi:amino acid adenylation domain-containing protein/FkbM family methyltransferase
MHSNTIEGFRLSPRQKQLWRAQQNNPAYRAQCLISIAGNLRPEILGKALRAVVQRHEILRTTFEHLPSMDVPLQVIADTLVLSDEEVSFSDFKPSEQEAMLDRLFREEGELPFVFEQGPLVRFKLLKLSAAEHALLINLPALCADARTLKNLVSEISREYDVAQSEEPRGDDEQVIQYVQYSEWLNEITADKAAEAGKAYWVEQQLPTLSLPFEIEPKAEPEAALDLFRPACFVETVDDNLVACITETSAKQNISVEVFLLTCWQVLLWKLTGETDLVVDTLFDGRKYDELNGALGLFASYLPVRVHIDENFRFADVLQEVDKVVNDAYERQEYFTREQSNGIRSHSASIKFDYEKRFADDQCGGLRFSLARQYVCLEHSKLRLSAVAGRNSRNSLALEFHYDQAAYRPDTIQRIAGELVTLLESAASRPNIPVGELNALGEAERRYLLSELNDTRAAYREDICLHQLFEAQVELTPSVTAVVYEDSSLTFTELNARANQLAHYLRALGVGPEVLVGICMERSTAMLVAVMAVLKAGGAYLPLDPAYPQERIAFILNDGQAKVLLAQERLMAVLPEHDGQTVYVDRDQEAIGRESEQNPLNLTTPENIAYVIYTSGSTGQPKGVMLRHGAVLNLILALDQAIYSRHKSPLRISMNAPLSFDASVKQLVQIAQGHTLYIVPDEIRPDSEAMLSFIQQHQLDVLDCTPTQLKLLVDKGLHSKPDPSPSLALVGGEALDGAMWVELANSPATVYYNVYGPTECTVDATSCRIGSELARPTIGLPLANVNVYLLDRQMRPVLFGVTGELCIGGVGLARGYLNRAELTAEKFMPHPFSDEPGARLYKTGDLARYRADGMIEFVGRADHQVKLRGLRIELGEIESVIKQHPAVSDAVVLVREDVSGDQRLVSYLVTKRKYAPVIEGRPRYLLPNGMAIVNHNTAETNYVYQEIFEDLNYLKHGIKLKKGACVFDVGANIGLFTLFVNRHCEGARIYAFEPLGPIFDSLRINSELYAANVKLFKHGLADEEGLVTFTYYPNYSTRSGVSKYADATDEVDVIKTFLQNKQESGDSNVSGLLDEADDVFTGFFQSEAHECRLRRLSDVMREQGIEHIDLLKVDVQRSELDVLKGVADEDWQKIDQVVMEVHDGEGQDTEGRVGEILHLLNRHGFEAVAEQDELLKQTDRYNLYAVRRSDRSDDPGETAVTYEQIRSRIGERQSPVETFSTVSAGEFRDYVRERLPDYMIPAAFIVLDELPLSRNGKVDRGALPAPEQFESCNSDQVRSAVTWYEELLIELWAEVLHVGEVSTDANFFEMGGHSLLATQLISRIREAFRVEIPLRSLFEEPTVAGLAKRIEKARGQGLEERAGEIERVERTERMPLSFAQQRLWFLNQLEPDSPFYNCPGSIRLTGKLDAIAFDQTLNEISRRHEILRTSFPTIEGQPVQLIAPAQPFKLPVIDLSELPEDQRELEAQRLTTEEMLRPFDLVKGPMLRITLLRLTEQEHVVLFTTHHIISDGWSMGVLVKEVSALYAAFSRGESSPLPDLAIQYADFAAWQREWLQGEALEEQLSYWRKQLSGAPPVLELPTDRPRPAMQSYRGANHPFRISAEVSAGLKALSRREGATLFMTLLAAFKVLLSRYSGQADISVGTDMAGRNRAEIEPLIGFFVNALVMRTEVRAEEDFRELLKRVREVCLGGYAHQDVPFEKLVEELNPERSLSYSPLFQVSFSLNNAGREALELSELTPRSMGVNRETAKFDLTLSMLEGATRLVGAMEYNTDLFDEATIARMISHFQQLLQSIVAHPDMVISRLPLLSEEETAQQLIAWNETAVAYPHDLTLHQLFEEQAAATPAAVALISDAEQIGYGELNERANQLAHYLRELGVGPEQLIGVCCERSIEMMVAVLGVLKAGAAYVPLDPEYPAARLAGMIEDAGIEVLLTQEKLLDILPPYGGKVISLDRSDTRNYSDQNLNSITTPQNTAYVIYTSGSTGRPKGVMVTHQSLVNFTLGMARQLELRGSDRMLQFASLSFDVFAEEVFPVWSRGGAVVLVGSQWLAAGAEFTRLLERQGVTGCELPAAFWHEWMRELPETGEMPPPSLRFVMVGCEKPFAERVAQWQSYGAAQLWRVFGLTETSITTTMYLAADSDDMPIGKPMANTEVYVLDRELQAVPLGVTGELYIGGDGVARGYWHRAEQTAERFVPHPFSREPGARLYRTGDLVRYQADGNLEFIGRGDEQVKVRGFRIELGEIESVLSTHAAVKECVVAVVGQANDKRLVAYVISDEGEPLDSNHLRAYLKERLPEYMAPSAFVTLTELPLTSNGKVDRKALPEPERNAAETGAEYVAARTPVEEVLSGIWEQVLKTEQVGINTNFFELGGHSLLATQVISRIRETFRVELPLRVIFESPTVAEQALRVEAALHANKGLETLPLKAVERSGDLPLSFAQERLWFLNQLEPESAFYNMPSGVRLSGELDVDALKRTLSEVIRRHEVLRTTFPIVDGVPVQRVSAAEPFYLPVLDLSKLPEPERTPEARRVAIDESRCPFDLAQGPMLRGLLLKLAEDDHIVLLTMHHVISDAWSTGVLIREVATLYSAFVKGEASPLAELPIQYADFAVWQREWLRGEVLERQLAYWREQLQGAPPVLDFPIDHPRPAVQSYRGALHLFTLPDELTRQLKTLTRRGEATLFMTLLAGFQVLLHRYTNMEDVVVGTPIAGRNRMEMEDLIGFFINSLTLRTRFSGKMSFLDVLRQVREVTLGAYANQDVPFEKLVEELQPERDLSRQPLFQILFALQNAPLGESDLPGITLTPFAPGEAAARFEITLDMTEFGEQLGGALRYNVDLFEESTIKRLAEHYVRLLEAVVLDPQRPISDLPLLSEEERHQQLVEWNDTRTEFPASLGAHRLFEWRVASSPLSVALIEDNVQLSYDELNQRANQLARHLRTLGVGEESRVGIFLPRSLDLVVSMLATLKAGGAYVPLDPQYPLERLSQTLEDAQTVVVVTNEELADSLPSQLAQVVMVDGDREVIEQQRKENLSAGAREDEGGEALAYLIYTSGSTGTPKGVAVTHRGITRLVCETNYASFAADEVFLQLAPASFDASTFEIWGALLNGARLAIMPDGQASLAEIGAALRQYQVTTLWLTAGLFHLMVEEQLEALLGLRQLLAGGDVLGVSQVRRFLEAAEGKSRLINGYGPTENTTFTCCHVMAEASEIWSSVPIGRAVSNTQVYVVDDELQAVPVGVSGELCIGGDGLARGYWRRPEQTAEKFVPNPFGKETGERLYRTGDLVRYLPDGKLEFIGRRDQQVKLRGFRIELGEIESVLGTHTSLAECIVAVIGEADDKRLVAYVVGHEAVDGSELRSYLKDRLPEYMVPSAFVTLEEVPLTPNGKVDRKALPEPEWNDREASSGFVAARTPVEELLCGIWEQLLKTEQVGIHENFFELGGHSLLATQVISRVRESFNVELPLRVIFESPTIAEISETIEEAMRAEEGVALSPINQISRDRELPLSFSQQRLWFIDRFEPESAAYNVPTSVRLRGRIAVPALEKALSELIRRHETLRTVFAEVEGLPVQVIMPAAPLHLAITDIGGLSEEERLIEARRLVTCDALLPFDLSRGPLLRTGLVRLADDDHIVLFTMHHIVSDGWSIGVLIREIGALYKAFTGGEPSPLPELSIQYADFAAWQREWLQGEVLESELRYWRQALSGAPAMLHLPTDRPRPSVQSSHGANHLIVLSEELTARLKELSRAEGVTLFMTLLASFQTLLYRYSGQDDIVIGTPIAGRNRADIEGLIGFFINTLVLRTRITAKLSFRELLKEVREVTLGAYTHQDLPFEKLVEELQPERDMGHTPLFQVMFALQSAPREVEELAEVAMTNFTSQQTTAKFDLTLSMEESGDRIAGSLEYNTDLFDAATIARMATYWQNILESIVTQPDTLVDDLELLSEQEHALLLEEISIEEFDESFSF